MAYTTRNITFETYTTRRYITSEGRLFSFKACRTRNITFESRILCFMAYRTRNTSFKARPLLFMAYGTRNITFEARFLWFINYRTRNTTLEACFLWFMAYTTRSITFEARFLLIMAYGTRRYITFKGRLFSFVACRTRILHLSRPSCGVYMIYYIWRALLWVCRLYTMRNIKFQAQILWFMA